MDAVSAVGLLVMEKLADASQERLFMISPQAHARFKIRQMGFRGP